LRAASGILEAHASELVIDNPPQEVVTHKKNGVVRYTDEFLRFCGLYGITPNACRPYRARTKGKVERPFYYLEEHLLRGMEIKELGELDGLLASITAGYNARPHSTLGEAPDKRFEEEKVHLRVIPFVDPTLVYDREIRKVSNDGYVSWNGGLYVVPMSLCLHNVLVEVVSGRTLKIYDFAGNAAIIDRLVHHADIFYVNGSSSYRLKDKLKKGKMNA